MADYKLLNFLIKITRFFALSEKELYPAWHGMQTNTNTSSGLL